MGQLSESEEKHLRPRVKQLICGSLNGMRIRQSLLQPYICWAGTRVSWKGQQLQLEFRDAVDCGEMDREDVRNEIVERNASGGKPGSHGSKVILLSHA